MGSCVLAVGLLVAREIQRIITIPFFNASHWRPWAIVGGHLLSMQKVPSSVQLQLTLRRCDNSSVGHGTLSDVQMIVVVDLTW
jgi:hypothetical protein